MGIDFRREISACCVALLAMVAPGARSATPALGIFDGHGDIGTVLHSGSVVYNPADKSYTVSGSGDNMWFSEDDFHFVWTKVSGDVALSADIAFIRTTGNNHRKA